MPDSAKKSVYAPPVEIALPGGTFKLGYDFRALVAIKKATGTSLLDGNAWEKAAGDPELLSQVLWAGLRLFHPQLSLDDVQTMMLPRDHKMILDTIVEAWTGVTPKPDPNEGAATEQTPSQ
jgi:hypothetical protein